MLDIQEVNVQTELLHITIIGCLVLLFGSTYRKRPSHVVRAWLTGWMLILVHFAAQLFTPPGAVVANVLECLSLGGLFACGLVFLSAPPRHARSRKDLILILKCAGACILAYTVMAVWNVQSRPAFLVAATLVTAAWLVYGMRLRAISFVVRVLLLGALAASSTWLGWAVWHSQFDVGLSALLTQLYILVGITYIGTVRRISAGTLTVSLGLVAWASVFPTATLLEYLHYGGRVQPEFWNVPKYFVAFGMMLMLFEDEIITANNAARKLSFQASHDQLTGLRNRTTLENDLRVAVEESDRTSVQCALICFDLDRFKHINDTYGHGIGDICLKVTGERLAALASGCCTAARIGGEEFGVVFSGFSSADQAEAIALHIQTDLRRPIRAESYLIEVTASVGVAVWPKDGADPASLWRNADAAMYLAKKSGGNQVALMSPEILRTTAESNEMELALRQALREDWLELWFQPIFRDSGQIHSVEALVRLRHPELGLVLPARFIELAEDRGLIIPLSNVVLHKVCAQLAGWISRGLTPMPIAINISAIQITSPDFARRVTDLLAEFHLDPSLVAMELTETAVLHNAVEASRQIDTLAARGISFSLDDFGVGYSSLDQLDKLDVDYLKIDRSFVARMYDAGETRSIVAAIISMAHSLGLQVIAEGIETQRTMNDLAEMGCDLFQGFYLGKPQTAADLEYLLASKRMEVVPMPLVGAASHVH